MYIYIMYVPVYIYISVYIQKKIDETSISWPSLFIWSITSICSDIYIYIVTTMTNIFNHKDTMMTIVNIIIINNINNNNSNIETTSVFHCKSSSKQFPLLASGVKVKEISSVNTVLTWLLARLRRLEKMTIEIVGLPIENGWIFHSYGTVYQRVAIRADNILSTYEVIVCYQPLLIVSVNV